VTVGDRADPRLSLVGEVTSPQPHCVRETVDAVAVGLGAICVGQAIDEIFHVARN
jgi:hypothetical protein